VGWDPTHNAKADSPVRWGALWQQLDPRLGLGIH